MPPTDEPIDVLDAGVSAVVRAINDAAGELDAVFLAELREAHGVPEWDRPAPMHLRTAQV